MYSELMNKKVVLFGAGRIGKKVLKELLLYNIIPAYFVDNSQEETKLVDITDLCSDLAVSVYSPNILCNEDKSNLRIIITVNDKSFQEIYDWIVSKSLSDCIFSDCKTILKGDFIKSYGKLRQPKTIDFEAPNHFLQQIESCMDIKIKEYFVDKNKYDEYFANAYYDIGYFPDNIAEKSLEHFVAADLLDLKQNDVYIDIASCTSPVPDIYERLYGVKAYKQDITYPDGINGNIIGGDAANMPIEPNFADKMALHCSFEHFEGDSDSLFIQEAVRVLRPGGKVCILPLYTSGVFHIVTDPVVAIREQVEFDEGVLLHCIKRYNNRYGRIYDADNFLKRVYNYADKKIIDLILYKILGVEQVSSTCYLDLALTLTKL